MFFVLSVPDNENTMFELERVKSNKSEWRICLKGTKIYSTSDAYNLENMLTGFGVDLEETEMLLKREIIQNVVFADFVIKKATSVLGPEAIAEAIDMNDKFMKAMVDVIHDLLNTKPKLKVVKNEKES
jgi:hypothetical protein